MGPGTHWAIRLAHTPHIIIDIFISLLLSISIWPFEHCRCSGVWQHKLCSFCLPAKPRWGSWTGKGQPRHYQVPNFWELLHEPLPVPEIPKSSTMRMAGDEWQKTGRGYGLYTLFWARKYVFAHWQSNADIFVIQMRHERIHRITVWFGLEGTFQIIRFQFPFYFFT